MGFAGKLWNLPEAWIVASWWMDDRQRLKGFMAHAVGGVLTATFSGVYSHQSHLIISLNQILMSSGSV
jgi:hypothetical protein